MYYKYYKSSTKIKYFTICIINMINLIFYFKTMIKHFIFHIIHIKELIIRVIKLLEKACIIFKILKYNTVTDLN